ncbi:hypothetical protein IWX48DRAFT_590582 [Phyllosticta citricarpa]
MADLLRALDEEVMAQKKGDNEDNSPKKEVWGIWIRSPERHKKLSPTAIMVSCDWSLSNPASSASLRVTQRASAIDVVINPQTDSQPDRQPARPSADRDSPFHRILESALQQRDTWVPNSQHLTFSVQVTQIRHNTIGLTWGIRPRADRTVGWLGLATGDMPAPSAAIPARPPSRGSSKTYQPPVALACVPVRRGVVPQCIADSTERAREIAEPARRGGRRVAAARRWDTMKSAYQRRVWSRGPGGQHDGQIQSKQASRQASILHTSTITDNASITVMAPHLVSFRVSTWPPRRRQTGILQSLAEAAAAAAMARRRMGGRTALCIPFSTHLVWPGLARPYASLRLHSAATAAAAAASPTVLVTDSWAKPCRTRVRCGVPRNEGILIGPCRQAARPPASSNAQACAERV